MPRVERAFREMKSGLDLQKIKVQPAQVALLANSKSFCIHLPVLVDVFMVALLLNRLIIKSQSPPTNNKMYQQKLCRHPCARPDCCQKDWDDKYLVQLTHS